MKKRKVLIFIAVLFAIVFCKLAIFSGLTIKTNKYINEN